MRKLFVMLTAVLALTAASKMMVVNAEETPSSDVMSESMNMTNEEMNEANAVDMNEVGETGSTGSGAVNTY